MAVMMSMRPRKRTAKPPPAKRTASPDEAVLVEIRRRAEAGRALSSGANRGDWLYAAAVRFFGSWGAAVEQAGFDYGQSKLAALTADQVLDRIRRLAADDGAARAGDHPIVAAGAIRHFGGWNEAFDAAGCRPPERRTWTNEAVLAAVRADRAAGLPVNSVAMARRNGKLYVAGRRRFGSWAATLAAADAAAPRGPRGDRTRR